MYYEFRRTSRNGKTIAMALFMIWWIWRHYVDLTMVSGGQNPIPLIWLLGGVLGLVQMILVFSFRKVWWSRVTASEIEWDSALWPTDEGSVLFREIAEIRVQSGWSRRRVEVVHHDGTITQIPSRCYRDEDAFLAACGEACSHIRLSADGAEVYRADETPIEATGSLSC